MTFRYIVLVLLAIALVLQFAVDRAPDLPESHDNRAARKVLMAGLLVMFIHVGRLAWLGAPANEVALISMSLICLSEISFCVNRLFPTVFVSLSARFHHAKDQLHERHNR